METLPCVESCWEYKSEMFKKFFLAIGPFYYCYYYFNPHLRTFFFHCFLRERKGERNMDAKEKHWLVAPHSHTWVRNRTHNLSVIGWHTDQLSHTGQSTPGPFEKIAVLCVFYVVSFWTVAFTGSVMADNTRKERPLVTCHSFPLCSRF